MSTPARINIPPFESPLLESWLGGAGLAAADEARMRTMAERGFLVLDLEHPGFDARAARIIGNLAPRYPDVDRRVMEAWTFDEDVRAIATDERVLSTLRTLYQREPIPFQTLNFDVGTEQAAHSDLLHFNCAPRRYMAGVWVALEDVDGDCGPLVVYPGSHKLPDLDMFELDLPSDRHAYGRYEEAVAAILREGGFEPEEVHLRRGQAIVWSANLFHGGTPIRRKGRTRHSQATHYYFADCLYYFPMESDPFVRRMCMREVIDIRTGRNVPNTYRGRALEMADYRQYMTYERPLPKWIEAKPPKDGDGREASEDAAANGVQGDRIRFLRETVGHLRETVENLRENVQSLREVLAVVHEDNRALRRELDARNAKVREVEALLHTLWKSRSFRLVHGIAKTLRIDRP